MDRKGLPARCLRASRPRNTRPKRPHFILHFGAFFGARPGGVAAPGRRALGAPGGGSYFYALGCFKLNRPSFVSRRALS